MNAPYRLLSPADRVQFWTGLLKRSLPGLSTLLLTLLMTLPVFASLPLLPHLTLLGVFIWATFQPGLMPPWVAFLLGLAADLLLGLPLGINATLLPLVTIFVRTFEARYGHHSYSFDWMVAGTVVVVFELAQWQLLAFTGTHGPFAPLLIQAATTVLAYPAVILFCARIQRGFAGDA